MQTIYESKDSNFCYVPIPKHASTWGNYVFGDILDLDRKIWSYDRTKEYIVILRDPLDKWFSGISQYIWQSRFNADIEYYLHDNFILDPLHLEMIFTKISFDVHSTGLLRYLREFTPGLENAKCTYFDFHDQRFQKYISHFIHKKFGRIVPVAMLPIEKRNATSTNKFKSNIKKQLKQVYDTNTRYKEILDDYFKEDYDFMKNIKFYKGSSNSVL